MTKWHARGGYCEACNCEAACPCYFLSPPTGESCTVVGAWHIDSGQYGSVTLEGLNVAYAAHRLRDARWSDEGSECFLYIDDRANETQRSALTQIFSGKLEGVPVILTRITNRLQGVRSAHIEYEAEGKRRRLKIPKVIELDIEAMIGKDGKETTLNNLPNWFQDSGTIAKSKRLTFHDSGQHWEVTERTGSYSPFSYGSG